MVFLLSAWIEKWDFYDYWDDDLGDNVRVLNLSWSYLTTLVTKLDLFKRCDGLECVQHLLLFKAAGKTATECLPPNISKAWLSKPRTTVSSSLPLRLSLSIGADKIKKIATGTRPKSASGYCNGFYFFLQVGMQGEEGKRTLAAYLHVESSALGLASDGTRSLGRPKGLPAAAVTCDIVSPGHSCHMDCVVSWDTGYGIDDCLGRTGATLELAVAPFMVDGKMEIFAEITDVQ